MRPESTGPARPPGAPRVRWWALGLLAISLLGLLVAIMLPSEALKVLRSDVQPLSRFLSWIDGLAPRLDMVHVLLFAWTTLCLRWVFPRLRAWQVALLALALAAGSEVLQILAPGRRPGLSDVGQDLLGVAVGLVIGWLLRAFRHPVLAAAFRRAAGLALLAAVVALPWMTLQVATAFAYPVRVVDGLLGLALGLRLLALAAGAPLRPARFQAWLAAYLLVMAVAVLAHITTLEFYTSGYKWIGVVYLALLAVLVHDLADSEARMRCFVRTWLATTALVVVMALAGGDPSRAPAGFVDASMLCNYLVVGLALSLAARSLGWLEPRLAIALAAAVTVAAVLTWSPGIGGVALVWSAWAWAMLREDRPHLARVAWVGGVVLALAVLVAFVAAPLDKMGAPSEIWRSWQDAVQTTAQHPWLGVGVGQRVVGLDPQAHAGALPHLTDAHNAWLSVAGQAGVFAALALASLLLHLARKPALPESAQARTLRWALVLAMAAAWGYDGLTSSVEDTRHLWLLLGLLAASRAGPASPRPASP